ncbi:type I restriction-modification system subunit M [Listeria cossartiae subsp. cayugensis]|uniref:site-specific DNA-methyltransferase (adenine-specific) n=1 Tax=Listeria cossartiae subsp. cayugensis TaxID=2713505 RepID=A0ABU2IP15_9LIST|nr:type I restriction-modification system subunit M [Listeria cossartiae]MDT0049404.1 type I restriction-modification system subunit M [Listeria cossartiae subsp. cayugensis]MDT0065907.1 type I restriction-modification system subunit M [Listeria cossartiae subsp. cayugensis]MDT0078489.1 type I restriction-modification system subunit M [Listeria cossartiae subsp. cayugensis]MDT0081325.1 type I restriction-modification system subunit M [Listeria cossartiae subsp. cayugensis]MDT0088140.1 type I r
MITSDEIKRRLWDGANELRGSMDASRYKDYMLGLMFYKFLSDKTLETYKSIAGKGQLSEAELVEEYVKDRAYHGENLDKMIQSILRYFVLPEHLYQTWLKDIAIGEFEVQKVIDSLNNFERTIAVSGDSDDFQGLFSSSTIDLTDTALGSNLNERSKNIKALIELFQDLNMVVLQKSDVLGDAYEYLIGQFAMESGKKAGEFYTPRQVSEVMAQIAAKTSNITSIYDPTVGSGSLLLTVKKHLKEDVQKDLNYYGQEKNTATYNLTRMNLLLHGVHPEKMSVKNGDTLSEDWPEDPSRPAEGVLFDAVVMNPPYSLANWNKSNLKVSDPRFEIAGVLPPDSKGDFAFLLHGLYHLGQTGTMAIVLPHGVLFRGGTEGEIRKRLLNKNYIDTIIGLPGNLFTNTGIPVCVLILKKNRAISDPVLVIDASRNFIKVGKQNELQEKDIARIVDTYVERAEKAGYSHLASREEIIENDYNMNIPRYVESIDEEILHDVDAHLYGGIPQANIDELKTLQTTVKNVLDNALKPIRDGYVQLEKPMDELTNEVLTDKNISAKSDIIREKSEAFIELYWKKLHEINNIVDVNPLMEEMLVNIKELLSSFDGIDVYDGYQIIAEVWKNSLTHDAELIAGGGFYTIGRTREPNMVTKGSGNKKREEQDGWVGAIVPNELIAKRFYSEELQIIEDKKARLTAVEAELSELVEAAKTEDSEENIALFESLKKNAEGEPQDSFESKTVKAELKRVTKESSSYELLKKADGLIAEKSSLGKEIKAKENELKEAVYERILVLTDEEIDELVFEKWFGTMVDDLVKLIELPLKKELDIIKQLHERYAETLDDIDQVSKKLENELEKLMSELVVK